mgnify:CR=1
YSFSGLTCDDYNDNKVAFDGAFKFVIAQEISGISASDVNIDEVSVNGDACTRQTRRLRMLSASSLDIIFTLTSSTTAGVTAEGISNALTNVNSATFL